MAGRRSSDMSTAGTPRSRRIAAGSLLVAVAAALAALLLPGTSAAGPASCANRNNNTYQKLLQCMTLEGVREHQAALQEIADENGGTRAAGTPGYDASVDYVVDTLKAAGWTVSTDRVRLHRRAADPATDTGPRHHARGGRRHRQHPGNGHRRRDPDRHQPGSSARKHERVRRCLHGSRRRGSAHRRPRRGQ